MPSPAHRKITPSDRIGTTPCVRLYHRGHTFRLARGDTHVAVFRGTVIEQRRYLVVDDQLPTGPVIEGPRTPDDTVPTPPGHQWLDTTTLRALAERWITANAATSERTGWHSARPAG